MEICWTNEEYGACSVYICIQGQALEDATGTNFLHKARCCIRGDKQTPHVDLEPATTYAPIASNEAIRSLLSFAAGEGHLIEGADISNAYLYGNLDVPIIMQQPTDSKGTELAPGQVRLLVRSLYGLRQAGEIWGSLLYTTVLQCGFKMSSIEKRVYHLKLQQELAIVDDLKFNYTRIITATAKQATREPFQALGAPIVATAKPTRSVCCVKEQKNECI